MIDKLFKNRSLAAKFTVLLSTTLAIGCITAIVLLDIRQGYLRQELDNNILSLVEKAQIQLTPEVKEQINASTGQIIENFGFELQLLMIGVAIFVVFAVYMLFLYLIRHRLADLAVRFRDVAEGDGDLTQRITLQGNDGIDKLGHHFNNLIEKIQNTMTAVVSAANQVSSASVNVTEITQRTSAEIMQQRAETDQIATAMNEMTATVQEVANNANNAASAAQNAQTESLEGKKTVEATIDAINTLAEEVTRANDVITQLQADSESIGTVLEVIRGIAEQTNLLALNAAIEAARAGEQGRGFAVVADEVRTLASRTQQSTEEIQDMIEKLQTGANNAAEVMNSGHETAQQSVEQASKAGAALDGITQAVITINEMNTQIAHSANEQQSVVSSMDQNLTSISHSANSTVEATQNTQTEIQELSRMAEELQSTLSQFKL